MGVPPVSEWLDMMPMTVTIAPWASQSSSTKPTYGSPVSYRCRIEVKNKRIVAQDGREIVSRGRVFLASIGVISSKDKITLPSDYAPINPPILAVNRVDDDTGGHHVVVEFG